MKKLLYSVIFIGSLTLSSCEKLLDVGNPKDAVQTSVIFKDEAGLQAAIAGMYNSGNEKAIGMISLHAALLADDLDAMITAYDPYTTNSLESNESTIEDLWSGMYVGIYRANAILDGVPHASFSEAIKNQALGEASFLRALYYFYMVNLFGDVPLITGIDQKKNELMGRTASAAIYTQIIDDLENAIKLLPATYPTGKVQRVRANKWTAAALLSRVYLYQGKYVEAEKTASLVIDQTDMYRLGADLNAVFLQGNKDEVIFAFDVSFAGYTTVGTSTVPTIGTVPSLIIHPTMVSLFEVGDARKAAWTGTSAGYVFPYKYKVRSGIGNEFDVVLRLSEQYLIRAEARVNLKNFVGAAEDVNKIRKRAKLNDVQFATEKEGLTAVEKERRVEFFAEWGHRWFDLKRTNTVNKVIGGLKPEYWQATDILYPIPSREREMNSNLTQNEGYD